MGADLHMEGALISAHVGYARPDAVERLNTPLYFLVAPPAQDIFALDAPLSTGLSSLLKTAGVFPMRYYFHVRRGQVTVLDHQGVELADIHEATRRGREIAASEAMKRLSQGRGKIIIDDGCETIFELSFEDIAD